ncbi:kinase-like domain-containing protein [Infundibulicybe gibba]|nr:kinase-like domain-containing protein [Infundibulicybe gibba]
MDLHRKTGVLPAVKVLDGEVIREGEAAIAGGTYSDIWIGKWLGEETVALKALRGIRTSIPQAQKRFVHEITVWSELKNDHILPFYGILTDQGPHIYMVSPWQENGNVLDYVRSREGANKIHLLAGAAKGVEYLHGSSITHGNIKCTNILVSQNGEARMCDFGMSKIIEEVTEVTASATLTASGSARWLAPELIEGVVSSPTKAADAYSYAMACLELLTGKYPFAHCKRDAAVIHDIVVLKRTPRRPEGQCVTDDMWAMMQRCWRSDSSARPSMGDIARQIQMFDDTPPPDL